MLPSNISKQAQEVFYKNWKGDEQAASEWKQLKETMSKELLDQIAHAVYLESAKQGDVEAMHWLADDYAKGEGCQRDLESARHWEICAANGGYIPAVIKLARLYSTDEQREDKFCEKNDSEAIGWYIKGVQMGSVDCQVELAQMYLYSEINDYKEAVNLLISAAEKGNVEAMYYLGRVYDDAQFGTEIYDEEKAVYWYGQAEQKGNKYAGMLRDILISSIKKSGYIGIKKNGFVRDDWFEVMNERLQQSIEVLKQEFEDSIL